MKQNMTMQGIYYEVRSHGHQNRRNAVGGWFPSEEAALSYARKYHGAFGTPIEINKLTVETVNFIKGVEKGKV